MLFPYERMLQKKFIINPLALQIYLPFAVTPTTVMKRQTLVPCLLTRQPSRQPPAGTSSRTVNFQSLSPAHSKSALLSIVLTSISYCHPVCHGGTPRPIPPPLNLFSGVDCLYEIKQRMELVVGWFVADVCCLCLSLLVYKLKW